MKFRLLGLLALLSGACATTSPPPIEPVPIARTEVRRPEVRIVVEHRDPAPRDDPRCSDIAGLAADGQYKPAVDQMALLQAAGARCSDLTLAALERARLKLGDADRLVVSSTRKKQEGDSRGARDDLEFALEIYPKYYWAAKLLRDLGGPDPAEMNSDLLIADAETAEPAPEPDPAASDATSTNLREVRRLIAEQNLELARSAELRGQLASASGWTIKAIQARPEDPDLRTGIVEYARLLGLKFFSAGQLTPARELWAAALELDSTDARLTDYLRQVEERLESLRVIRNRKGE